MFCEGRLRLVRRVFELEEGVEYERPLLSLPLMRVATSMDGGGINGEAGNGCCCSCTSDMALPERYDLLYGVPAKKYSGEEAPSEFTIYRHEAR